MRWRAYVEARAQHREAIVQEAMDAIDHERQRTGYSWPDRETRFAARREAGLRAEEEVELAQPLLAFEDWVEAGAPERYRAEGPVALGRGSRQPFSNYRLASGSISRS